MNNKLAVEKNINDLKVYVSYQNRYKYFLEKMLYDIIDLKKYDKMIGSSELDFGKSTPTKKQLYTLNDEYFDLDYIFLVNRFYIEKLSIEELSILKSNNEEEIHKLIENTYKEIIKDNYRNNEYTNQIYKVKYGTSSKESNFIPNNNIVFKIIYSKNNKKYTDEEYIKNMKEKRDFLNNIIEEIKEEIKSKLDIDCSIIVEKLPN